MLDKVLIAVGLFATLTGSAPQAALDASKQIKPLPVLPVPNPIRIDHTKPKPKDLTFEDQLGVFKYGSASVDDLCQSQPSTIICSEPLGYEVQLDAFNIVTISLQTKRDFVYAVDVKDSWRVWTQSVQARQTWYGDCDDLTSTTIDMIARTGQSLQKIWMVLVSVEHKANLDHIVGMVEDSDGNFWIVGDTNAQNAYPVSELKYRVVGIARADRPTEWMDPKVLGVFNAENLQQATIVPTVNEEGAEDAFPV